MPKYRQVSSLQTLALKSVGNMVTFLAPKIVAEFKLINNSQEIPRLLQLKLDSLKELLVNNVSRYLMDQMAVEVLEAVKCLIDETKKCYYAPTNMSKFLIEMNVVVSLTEVVLNDKLKEIDLTKWPKIMRYVIYKNLNKMSGIEVLNIGSCLEELKYEHERNILQGIGNMKNLRSLCLCFVCTDQIIQHLSDNCPHLQCLDVTSSRSVTDRSISYLLNFKELKNLQLHHTSVSVEGLAHLLIGLPNIEDIGKCVEFSKVVKYLYYELNETGPFALKKFQTQDLTTDVLRLFLEMFPNIENMNLFHLSSTEMLSKVDITIISPTDHLKQLKSLSVTMFCSAMKDLLQILGSRLEVLKLEHIDDMYSDFVIDVSDSCPFLKSLVFYNCNFRFMRHQPIPSPEIKPFQHLERLFWMSERAFPHLEFILSNAFQIKNIHLGSSSGINHFSLLQILEKNPMVHLEELRILHSNDMNMKTVHILLSSCPKLCILSELESWLGISDEQLEKFRSDIMKKNYDLDTTPTLSYHRAII